MSLVIATIPVCLISMLRYSCTELPTRLAGGENAEMQRKRRGEEERAREKTTGRERETEGERQRDRERERERAREREREREKERGSHTQKRKLQSLKMILLDIGLQAWKCVSIATLINCEVVLCALCNLMESRSYGGTV